MSSYWPYLHFISQRRCGCAVLELAMTYTYFSEVLNTQQVSLLSVRRISLLWTFGVIFCQFLFCGAYIDFNEHDVIVYALILYIYDSSSLTLCC